MFCKVGLGIHLSLYLFVFTIHCIILRVSCTSSSLSNVFWNLPNKQESEIGTRIKRASVSGARISLIHNPKCRDDLKRLCTSLNINSDDLSVLECIETAKVRYVRRWILVSHIKIWSTCSSLFNRICTGFFKFIWNQFLFK